MKKETSLFVLIILFSSLGSATLGISPAITKINFAPGEEYELSYNIISDQPNIELEAYVEGDLAEYVQINKKKFTAGESFSLNIKFPMEIKKPGEHTLLVGAKEKPPEDQFIGTAINIRAVIKIFVPYPGKYAEAELNIPNGNIDEQIPVELHVINRGNDNLYINTDIKFFKDNNEFVYEMPFNPVFLNSTQDVYFRKFLNTSGYKSGNYFGEAEINYGDITKVNKTFRIGSLFVNVTNFTRELPQGGIQKFFIDIESLWNSNLQEVYADVNLSNILNASNKIGFRTPSIDLGAWEKKTLEGFLDTTGLEGSYRTEIVLNYGGEESSSFGTLFILRKGLNTTYIIIGLIAIAIILAIIIIVWRIKKASLSNVRVLRSALRRER